MEWMIKWMDDILDWFGVTSYSEAKRMAEDRLT